MDNNFKRFFTYILNEYCEETCTSQDELFALIEDERDSEKLSDLFIEEGFLKWVPEEFICIENKEDDRDRLFLDFEDRCAELYWETICDRIDADPDQILEYL